MLSLAVALTVLASNLAPAPAKPAPAKAAPAPTATAHQHDGECHHPPVAEAPKPAEDAKLVLRGEKIGAAKAVPVSSLLADASKHDGKELVVEGTVRKACSRKGCWMELATSEQDKAPGVRVTFKDYGFFVPLDSAGSQARVAGKVQLAELSEERAAHYASEGATIPRGTDGKPREVQVVASGVELRR